MAMIDDLRVEAKRLLENGEVWAVVGYTESQLKGKIRPLISFDPESAENLIWDGRCNINLAGYLVREPLSQLIKKGKRVGIVAKGCDLLSVSVLIQENKLKRDLVYIIGVACPGIKDDSGNYLAKCRGCQVQIPQTYDLLIGSPEITRIEGSRYHDVLEILKLDYNRRWDFWIDQFKKCIKCYACRQACPLCYCETCLTDKTVPQWVERNPSISGNLFFHFMRAMHLAGRCVGCGECARACPLGIPVDVLTRAISYEIEKAYGYYSGADTSAKPFLGSFSKDDPDDLTGNGI
ncbi:MAG: Fe-S oxidoreductase [bacterium]